MSGQPPLSITQSRKRTRDDVEEHEIDTKSFTIKPDASDPFAAPRTFTPICLLPRAQLPLACIDTSTSGSSFFAAQISVLESAHGQDDGAPVLVATENKEKRLYAVERVQRRLYAMCRLGGWVTEEQIVANSRCLAREERQAKRRAVQPVENSKPWWMAAAVDMPQTPQHARSSQLRLDMDHGKLNEGPLILQCDAHSDRPQSFQQRVADDDATLKVQDPTAVLQDLCGQYLEALYLSRTSLAYFTKGPLSRARAAFAAMSDTAATSELVDFLRESVLSSTTMDKKFKEGISAVVKEMAAEDLLSPGQTKKTKRKRKWKAKRDKHGLFTDEKDVVQRWWREADGELGGTSSGDTVDAILRRRLPKLRSRETFMQIILILEILALEASMSKLPGSALDAQAGAPESQGPETQDETQKEDKPADIGRKKSKVKKSLSLPALLETLLDKLCIWHSLESHSPAKKSGMEEDGHEEVSDELKSFCVEVIIPFYIPRISEHAVVVNKKLGGPSALSPVKRKTGSARKPGEPAARPAPEKKPRKPLARVATDTLRQDARRVPSLHRSATDTDTLSSCIKRETSEVPLDSIPATNQQRKPRQSLMHTLDSSRRQVDLTAMSQANDAKLHKKAEMQEKMQSAINMLRKPNRAAALEEIRSQTDESFAKATAATKSRPRQKTAQRAQVAATPSHGKAVKATPHKRASRPLHAAHAHSSAHVTSSSAGRTGAQETVPSSSFAIPQTGHRPRHSTLAGGGVEETPSRGFAKFMPVGLARQPGTLDSPTVSRKIDATPSKPVRSLSLGVNATPAPKALVAVSPNVQRYGDTDARIEAPASRSIYDALGWDEDEYEELS